MKKKNKVTLLELVATKIVYAVLIATYYWMWARRDWHNYYESIQYAVAVFTIIFLTSQASRIIKFKKEIVDEMALANLKRADSVCLKIALVSSIVIAFAGAMEVVNQRQMGYIIMAMLIVFSALILLSICFYVFGKINARIARKNKAVAQGKDEDDENIDIENDSSEVIAAISMALHQHLNAHDYEDTILTINKVKRAYSPWSSKIYSLR